MKELRGLPTKPQGLAEEEGQAHEAEKEQCRSMLVVLKITNDKIHIEEGANNPVRAFGVGRRAIRKVFTKEMSLEQDFKEGKGVSHANRE